MGETPLLGSIGLFAGDFAPRTWAFCQGQLLPISQNTALFSILGTTYGGDGRTTFALPDLRGRAAIQQGHGPGLSVYTLGGRKGQELNTMTVNNMPLHTHSVNSGVIPVSLTGLTGTIGGTAAAKLGVDSTQSTDDPNGGYPATNPNGESTFSGSTDGNAMAPAVVDTSNLTVSVSGTAAFDPSPIQVLNNGGGQPFSNIQPTLGLNYCICLNGIFPSRS